MHPLYHTNCVIDYPPTYIIFHTQRGMTLVKGWQLFCLSVNWPFLRNLYTHPQFNKTVVVLCPNWSSCTRITTWFFSLDLVKLKPACLGKYRLVLTISVYLQET